MSASWRSLFARASAKLNRSAGGAGADSGSATGGGRQLAVTFYHDVEQDLDCAVDPAACRDAVDALLEVEARHGIRATYNVVGRVLERDPELVARIAAAGHEIAFHSSSHDPEWDPARYADEVRACRQLSSAIAGYRSPRSQWDATTLDALWSNGFLWNAESDPAPEPYFIHHGLVRLPIGADDWGAFTGQITLDAWVARFSELAAKRRYFGWGSHDCVVASRPADYLAAYERVLDAARERNARVITFGQAAEEFRGTALADHYTATAKAWNGGTRRLYRTKRFQELLLREIESMPAPVVVDLGSAGGVLSVPLAAVASRVYCVDRAPGMLADLPQSDVVRGVLGDVVDSTLEAASADLVICARVLEYLYDPDRAADEIRRIAKPGATVFATFPADRGVPARNPVQVPDRIRRHFTRQQVMRWGERVGAGHVFGVQYDEAEPSSEVDEREYRRLEEEAPEDRLPTNWVYVGRVDAR